MQLPVVQPATMAGLSLLALLLPRTRLNAIWRLNPDAHTAFLAMGAWSLVLLVVLSAGCAASAYALWRGSEWGRRLAVVILVANLAGDAGNAIFRGDLRTLIGLPIGGVMVWYLLSGRARVYFEAHRRVGEPPPTAVSES